MDSGGKDLGEGDHSDRDALGMAVPGSCIDSDNADDISSDNSVDLEFGNSGEEKTEAPGSAVVAARGTGDGLVLRLDGRVDPDSLKEAIIEFVDSRRSFLGGNDVLLEWIGRLPKDAVVADLKQMLKLMFSITVKGSSLKEHSRIGAVDDPRVFTDQKSSPRKRGLFGGIEDLGYGRSSEESDFSLEDELGIEAPREGRGSDMAKSELWDDPDARIVYGTLRSGQKVETEHSIVIVGDVNSGAEIVAGGDVIVLGTLRGVAHAGAYDETGGGRFIFSLCLRPTQLRIGAVISRGSSESGKKSEIARVDGNMIVVEPYNARQVTGRLRSW